MIDINEVLRRALMAAREQLDAELRSTPKPEIKLAFKHGEIRPNFGALDLRRRPDGVWELPE